jgi:hypothetical protein
VSGANYVKRWPGWNRYLTCALLYSFTADLDAHHDALDDDYDDDFVSAVHMSDKLTSTADDAVRNRCKSDILPASYTLLVHTLRILVLAHI